MLKFLSKFLLIALLTIDHVESNYSKYFYRLLKDILNMYKNLPFLDLFNSYNFCVKLFNNDREYNK